MRVKGEKNFEFIIRKEIKKLRVLKRRNERKRKEKGVWSKSEHM